MMLTLLRHRRRQLFGVALAVSLALAPACRSGSGGAAPAAYPLLVPGDFGGMHNVSTAGPIWIGGMPDAEDLELAQRRGIKRVIDISVPSEVHECDVVTECGQLGLDYATAGLVTEDRLTSESVDLVLAELADEDLPSTLMFCGTGGRCAIYLAIYRVMHLQVPLEDALVEARRAGMEAGESADFVRSEVARLRGEASSGQLQAAAK